MSGWKVIFLVVLMGVFASVNAEDKMSLNFRSIKIRELLQLLTEQSGKSVIISEKIYGKTSIVLNKVSWREALNVVLKMQGLSASETENIIVIAPSNELDKNEQLAVQPRVFNLHNASADNVSKLLKPAGVLSQAGNAAADLRTNKLLVSDSNNKIEAITNILQQLDIPGKQVLIEARIVSADEDFVRELGVEFGVGQDAATEGKTSSGKINFMVAKLNSDTLIDLELSALENEGRGKVIATPKLLTTDREPAYIESGDEIPYQEKSKSGNTSTAFKKAVLSLKVTPEVIGKNMVNLALQLNQDKVSQLTFNGVPAIDTRQIQTKVLVHSGETIVLGGIYEWSKSNSIASVPFLGKIPVVGLLFSKHETKLERKELLMFVTPKIIDSSVEKKEDIPFTN